ncbi:MAG: NUDIX hydrolase [Eubacteriales bacterium]
MRAPFQILAVPYKINNGTPLYCVMRRSDAEYWQFIAGGGEDNETVMEAAKREIFEESGLHADNMIKLTALSYVPADCIAESHRKNWPADTYVIPEHCFAFECCGDITLSNEHTEFMWLAYEEAWKALQWDSNRTALYELKRRLEASI